MANQVETRHYQIDAEFPLFDRNYVMRTQTPLGVDTVSTKLVIHKDKIQIPIVLIASPGDADYGIEVRPLEPTQGYQFDDRDLDPDQRADKLKEAWRQANLTRTIDRPPYQLLLLGKTLFKQQDSRSEIPLTPEALSVARNLRLGFQALGREYFGHARSQGEYGTFFDNFYPLRNDGRVPAIPEEPQQGEGLVFNMLRAREGNPVMLIPSVTKLETIRGRFRAGPTRGIPEAFLRALG